MRRVYGCSLGLGAASVLAAITGRPLVANNVSTIPGAYIVEFANGHNKETFYYALSINGLAVTSRMDLNFSLFQGVSFTLAETDHEHRMVSKVASMPAVKQMWPIRKYPVPNVQRKNLIANPGGYIRVDESTVNGSDAFSTHVMTQVNKLHALGYSGTGTRIGIVDTGVDYLHPALGGCFGKDCLIGYGYDLVGDNWTETNTPTPDPDPYDNCQGHGTHVSGIAAAQPNALNFTGVAPGATLGMYRVFSCRAGGTTDDVLISAFNMAYEDGSDIITASIGQVSGWSELPWSTAVSRIVEAGVPCTLAAGNDGQYGLFTASDAADGNGVIAVGSFDNTVIPYLVPEATYVTSSPRGSLANTSFGWLPGYPRAFGNISLPLTALSNNTSVVSDACNELPTDTLDLSGSVVLIRLGGCETAQKARNAYAKKARYIVFYAGDTGELTEAYLYGSKGTAIKINGTGTVTAEQGVAWVDALNRGESVQVQFVSPGAANVVYLQSKNGLTGGFASAYTSFGPTLGMNVYPTVGAPGGNILSTFLLSEGGYAVYSGTSMATPFVAATYALVQEVRKKSGNVGESDLATLLSSTSQAQLWNDGSGTLNDLAPVPQQGTGLVQAYAAAFTSTLLTTQSISFNDTDHKPENMTFTLENTGSDTITYTLSNIPAIGMYVLYNDLQAYFPAYFPNPIFAASAGLNFSQDLVNLAPKERALITVTASPPSSRFDGDNSLSDGLLPIYSGYIAINGSNGDNVTIPYLGLAGSFYQADNIDPAKSSMLGCASEGHEYECKTSNLTYSVPYPTAPPGSTTGQDYGYSYPEASLTVDLGSALIRADVIPLSTNYSSPTTTTTTTTVLGNKTAGSVYGFPRAYQDRFDVVEVVFTGMLADGTVVPAGEYALAVRALRLFGDPDEVGDYSTLKMIPFTLEYTNTGSSSG